MEGVGSKLIFLGGGGCSHVSLRYRRKGEGEGTMVSLEVDRLKRSPKWREHIIALPAGCMYLKFKK